MGLYDFNAQKKANKLSNVTNSGTYSGSPRILFNQTQASQPTPRATFVDNQTTTTPVSRPQTPAASPSTPTILDTYSDAAKEAIRDIFNRGQVNPENSSEGGFTPITMEDAIKQYEGDKRLKDKTLRLQNERDLFSRQTDEISKFEKNMPMYENMMQSDLLGEAKKKISAGQRQIAAGANRRGLLYSGIKEGQQADYAGQVAGDVAQQLPEISLALEARREEMKDRLAQYQLGKYEQDVSEAQDAYKRALASWSASRASFSGVGQAAGALVGTAVSGGNPAGGMVGAQIGGALF